MADWKTQISYNYNPSYHAFAYGLVYQPEPEQTQANLSSWADTGVTDLSSYNAGATQGYYTTTTTGTATPRTREETPPQSPEQHAVSGHCHYQGSGVVYLGDSQAGRLLLAGPHRASYDVRAYEARRAGSDSTSDSEAHTSPDSWSSGSSREGNLPQADPAIWIKDEAFEDKVSSGSPDGREDVSKPLMEGPRTIGVPRNKGTNNTTSVHMPINAPKSTTVVNNPRAKVRAAFSESQMNALVQRFSVQRYLTPVEMKNLAELTGLTYKQVKTWFQNRRMKLRRNQKDTSWVSERYTNKESPVRGNIFTNIPQHIPLYQREAEPQLKEHYKPHVMETAFKKTAPQNLAFYLAAMGSTAGSTGYPSWPSGAPQTAVPTRPQMNGWSMPPGVRHYEYNPSAFSSACVTNNTGHDSSFEVKDGESMGRSTINTALVQNASQ